MWRRCFPLPEKTENDDGDGERDDGHAVADGVAHFDGREDFFLRGEQARRVHTVTCCGKSLSEPATAGAAAARGPWRGLIMAGADHVIVTGVVLVVSTVHYVRLHADVGPAVLGAGLGQVAC